MIPFNQSIKFQEDVSRRFEPEIIMASWEIIQEKVLLAY